MQQNNEGGTIDYEVDVIAPLPLVMQDEEHSYVYGLDLISAVDGSANEVYYLYDGLGSVAALTDDSGVETDSYVYDAFGALTSSTGITPNDWLFTGEQRDGDTELYFLRARYYDPEIGRFLGRDPLEFAQRYAYAGNNPVAYTDPSGLKCKRSWGGIWGCVQVTLEAVSEQIIETAVPSVRGSVWATAWTFERGSGCGRNETIDGITFHYECGGVVERFLDTSGDDEAVTVGHDVLTTEQSISPELMLHEACHVGQYDRYGDDFFARYFGGKFVGDPFEALGLWFQRNADPLKVSPGDARAICAGRRP